jgi:hypothetical protein
MSAGLCRDSVASLYAQHIHLKTSALKYKPHLRHFLKKSLGAQIQAMSRVRIEMMHGLHVIEKTGLQMVQHLEMVR